MPTPIEQTIAIILGPDSKLRDQTPLIYQLPNQTSAGNAVVKKMRFLSFKVSGDGSILAWLNRDYGTVALQSRPFDKQMDQSEIFTTVRDPKERWWSGIRHWMQNLPWYAWWMNDKIMTQWPHFNRHTLRIHDIMQEIQPHHLIKVDSNLGIRMENFARRHGLNMYGQFPHNLSLRHSMPGYRNMENKGRSQLEAWLKLNPDRQKQLDDYLEPDYQYWNQVKDQE